MRYRNFPFKSHIYNFKFISNHFGSQGILLLKRWIDTNYRIIKTHSKLYFLKNCKAKNIFSQHASHIMRTFFNIFHYKAFRKLERLILHFKLELIQIETFDLYKYCCAAPALGVRLPRRNSQGTHRR